MKIHNIFLFGVVLLTYACTKDNGISVPNPECQITQKCNPESMVLGNQLLDPYDTANMGPVFRELLRAGMEFGTYSLCPTGKYVRVAVSTSEEEYSLIRDTTIIWINYPMDYEILEDGYYYHDASLPDTVDWIYAVVPTNYSFPSNQSVELLHYVFIPEDYSDYSNYEEAFDSLEMASVLRCDTLNKYTEEDDDNPVPANMKSSNNKWAPSATINVWDDTIGSYYPLKGARVTAQHYTKVKSCTTNSHGECTLPNVFPRNHRVKYGITWRLGTNNNWIIKDGSHQATYSGPRKTGHWTAYINSGKGLMHATMHAAMYECYFNGFDTLSRFQRKMTFRYRHSTNGGKISLFTPHIVRSTINIWGYKTSNHRYKTYEIYAAMMHEFGYAYLFSHNNPAYFSYNSFIKDSWAVCTECYMTANRQLYLNHYPQFYYGEKYQKYKRNTDNPNSATPVFYDLIDTRNQKVYYGDAGYCDDQIDGFRLSKVFNFVCNSHNYSQLYLEFVNYVGGYYEDILPYIALLSPYAGLGF